MAQAAVTEKYRQYEELASRDGSRFHPDARHPPESQPQHDLTPIAVDTLGHGGRRNEKTVPAPGQ
jgi:hypothetical protein